MKFRNLNERNALWLHIDPDQHSKLSWSATSEMSHSHAQMKRDPRWFRKWIFGLTHRTEHLHYTCLSPDVKLPIKLFNHNSSFLKRQFGGFSSPKINWPCFFIFFWWPSSTIEDLFQSFRHCTHSLEDLDLGSLVFSLSALILLPSCHTAAWKYCWASGSINKHWVVPSMYAIQAC